MSRMNGHHHEEVEDKLVEIPQYSLIKLRNMFKANWPKNITAYYLIENYMEWLEKVNNIKNLKIYCLNGEWRKDGTFVIIDRYRLFMYTLDESNKKLKRILNLLDWSKGFDVSSVCQRHLPAVLQVMEKKRLPIEKSFMLNFHYLPKEEALKFDTAAPEGIYLKQLVPSDGQKINDLWPHAHNGSLYFIQRLIEMNLNIGAFTKEEDELIAWCLRIEMGSFGSLQVDERFQRRGLGSLMVKLMSRRLAEQSKDITAGIVDSNYKSRQMFQKLGFKHIDDTHWFTIAPTIPHYRWVD